MPQDNYSVYGQFAIFIFAAWAGTSGGGVIAGLAVCGVVVAAVSQAAVLMQARKNVIAGAIVILMIRTPTRRSCRLQVSKGMQHSRQPMPVPSQNALLGRSSSYAASRPNTCCIRAAGEAVD